MVGKRVSKRLSTITKDDVFVSADKFDFGAGLKSPKGAMTRARRSSVSLKTAPLPQSRKPNRRQSMMPTLAEIPVAAKPATTTAANKRRQSLAVGAAGRKAATTTSGAKGIAAQSFYQSPVKKSSAAATAGGNGAKRKIAAPPPPSSASPLKLVMAPSPTKKAVSRYTFLSDSDIIENLDDMFDKTPPGGGKKVPKTFETEAPEKVKPRRAMIELKSPVVAVSRAKTPGRNKSLTAAKKIMSAKQKASTKTPKSSRAGKTSVKSDVTPVSAATSSPINSSKRKEIIADMKPVSVRVRRTKTNSTPAASAKKPATSNKAKSSGATPRIAPKRKLEESEDTPVVTKRLKTESPRPSTTTKSSGEKTPRNAATPAGQAARRILTAKRTSGGSGRAVRAFKNSPAARRLTGVVAAAAVAPVGTPVQVNPSNLLRRNMKHKVETAIVSKISQRPDSSPYLLTSQDENSPKFEKVKNSPKLVKPHITGTPAMAAARRQPAAAAVRRKFGTVLQPSLLALDSPATAPRSGLRTGRRHVKSSTPVVAPPPPPKSRGLAAGVTGEDTDGDDVHPLDLVEATPIRAPAASSSHPVQPLSPPPQMVTGGLAKMCIVM